VGEKQPAEEPQGGVSTLATDKEQQLHEQLEHASFANDHPVPSPWKEDLMREMGIDLANHERLALQEMSELVSSGRPRLSKILETEVDRSAGKTLIACACSSFSHDPSTHTHTHTHTHIHTSCSLFFPSSPYP
jgi:hypothetical protein